MAFGTRSEDDNGGAPYRTNGMSTNRTSKATQSVVKRQRWRNGPARTPKEKGDAGLRLPVDEVQDLRDCFDRKGFRESLCDE